MDKTQSRRMLVAAALVAVLGWMAASEWLTPVAERNQSGQPAHEQLQASRPVPNNAGTHQEPTAAHWKIARAIAHGHAYQKHVVDEQLFPEIKNRDDFENLIGDVLANPTVHRELENGRAAYYDEPSNTLIIFNPHARDNGTCFRPRAGLKYVNGLQ